MLSLACIWLLHFLEICIIYQISYTRGDIYSTRAFCHHKLARAEGWTATTPSPPPPIEAVMLLIRVFEFFQEREYSLWYKECERDCSLQTFCVFVLAISGQSEWEKACGSRRGKIKDCCTSSSRQRPAGTAAHPEMDRSGSLRRWVGRRSTILVGSGIELVCRLSCRRPSR